jgi:UDP-2,3-diacylglucosamine pyrophosphatase LpxH
MQMAGIAQGDAVVISDLHLGSDNCQARAIGAFLEELLRLPEGGPELVIAGDVFDSIDFRRLKKTHWRVLSLIRKLSDKRKVTWIAGNHDGSAEIISHLLGVAVCEEYVLESAGRRVLVIHGHKFDEFIDTYPLVTWLADQVYFLLQKIDRTHYVARLAKQRSKIFVRCRQKIEVGAVTLAKKLGCTAVICGHTHQAVSNRTGPVHYFNCGCWTEKPMTYVAIAQGWVELRTYEYDEENQPYLAAGYEVERAGELVGA